MEHSKEELRKHEKSLVWAVVLLVTVLLILAIIGFFFMKPPTDYIEGQADATAVKISGKLPGRIHKFFVSEGDSVKAGDTLVQITSSTVEAKLAQAQAMRNAAAAQSQKANNGARSQTVQAAYELWQQASAAREIAKKTFDRMENLFSQDVISAQKRDEAEAAYKASIAAESAAKSQYDLATEGARREDKASAAAMVSAAAGSVKEVKSLLEDEYLVAPCDGRIDVIYPNEGELVAMGSPIMGLLKEDDKWVTFNVNEGMLNGLEKGQEITIIVPALDNKEVKAKIYYIRDMGDYAAWRATKASGQWDSRTFQIKARPVSPEPRLLPGMTILFKKPEK